MTHRTRIRRRRGAGLLAAVAVAAVLGDQLAASSSSTAPPPARVLDREHPRLRSEHRPLPGAAGLDPALLDALRRAATAAANDGVELVVDSGRRSRRHQQQLFDEAVARYGSAEQAARWVATPDTSAHVSGDAVDIGPAGAAAWLSRHGAGYGLCQIYGNEPWHFELRPRAGVQGCPPLYADPTHDPRMQE